MCRRQSCAVLYCVIVRRVEREKPAGGKTKKKEGSIRGPPRRTTIPFDPEHPLAESHVQRLLDKNNFPVPVVTEKPLPAPMPGDTNTSSPAHRRCAAWYGSLLWPWEVSGDAKGTAKVFTWDELTEART